MDDELLQKIDIIRERVSVSYREALEALNESDGDVVQAIILLEQKREEGLGYKLLQKSGKGLKNVKEYISTGNNTKIRLKRGDKTIAEFPATIGALGIIAALASAEIAIIAGIGAAAAISKKVYIEVERTQGDKKVFHLTGKDDDEL